MLFSLELVDPDEGALEGCLTQRVGKNLTAALSLLRVGLPTVEQVIELRSEIVSLVLAGQLRDKVLMQQLLSFSVRVKGAELPPTLINGSLVLRDHFRYLRFFDAHVCLFTSHHLHGHFYIAHTQQVSPPRHSLPQCVLHHLLLD